MKRKFTFVHLRGDSSRKFSAEKNRHTNGLEKKNGWYKLVAKTPLVPLECNSPLVANVRWQCSYKITILFVLAFGY